MKSNWKYELFGAGIYIRITPESDAFYLQRFGRYFKLFPAGLKGMELLNAEVGRLILDKGAKPGDLWKVLIYQRSDGFLCLRANYTQAELEGLRVTALDGEFEGAAIPALGA